jgi:hypothetical protein
MHPKDALSPRDRIWPGSLQVIYISKDRWWSLATMRWLHGDDHNDPNSWGDALGCRWNGDINDPDDKGNPRSHGQGTWFILPDPLAALARALVAEVNSERAFSLEAAMDHPKVKSFVPPDVGDEIHIIRRLGWALVRQWRNLSDEDKKLFLEQAHQTDDREVVIVQLAQQIDIFLEKYSRPGML